ncbi:phosphatidate phosphatase [Malassezia cuniculi]|uniref:phosphatidate phosphatase n=1 Tax=Malassezia cuniculi TaxID=948313 RepID=A0AAF0J6U7_9BASI|nr:phosphatidate phosphatase [Malassezia cuniculi]
MDLNNLRESLDSAYTDGGRRACDERLTNEFRGYIQALQDTLDSIGGDPSMSGLCEILTRRIESLREDDEHEDAERTAEASPRRPSSTIHRPHQTPRAPSVTPNGRASVCRGDGSTLVTTATATPSPNLRALKATGTGMAASEPLEREYALTYYPRPTTSGDCRMQYVGKLVSSVYNTITPSINPSTLTGAIDVIVVEREVETDVEVANEDGTTSTVRRRTTELSGSPFHVRFGKMSVIRPADRKVTLHLNGSPDPLPFAMKVADDGEAHFVMEIDNDSSGDVPSSLVTSPIVSATSDEENAQLSSDPEPLDIGQAVSSPPAATETPATSLSPETDPADITEEYPQPFGEEEEVPHEDPPHEDPHHNEDPLRASATSKEELLNMLDMEGYKFTKDKQAEAFDQGKRFAAEMPLSRRHGGYGSMGLGERLDRPHYIWKRWYMATGPGAKGEFPDIKPGSRSRRLSESSISRVPMEVPSPQASKVGEGRPTLRKALSDTSLSITAERVAEVAKEAGIAQSIGDISESIDATGAKEADVDASETGKLTCSPEDPYLYLLEINENTIYSFELSLCATSQFGSGGDDAFLFGDSRVSFQRFLEDDSIVSDRRLCMCHAGNYYTWENSQEMLSTLAYYREHLISGQSNDETTKSGWLWWGRKSNGPKPAARAQTLGPEVESILSPSSPAEKSSPKTEAKEKIEQNKDTSAKAPPGKTYVKSLRLTSDQLKQLNLRKGTNTISFSVTSSYSGVATCQARIFLWESTHRIVVSDIDGTITKSDALGHLFTLMGKDWTHLGVAKLYHDIAKNGYRMMYLTSRAIGQAEITRDYLKNINQNNYRLPDGPVIMSPDRLIASLHREVILKKPEVFKMACLRDIARLFGMDPHSGAHDGGKENGEKDSQKPGSNTPFYAGFGNRITDALSYRSVNIPSSRIFTIDSNGEVKMELLELAGYNTSYPNMTDLVDQMFPPFNVEKPRDAVREAFTDFNYWRDDVVDVELPPDDELLPPVPTSPSVRSLRSPLLRAQSTEPTSPQMQPSSPPADRPSRLSRFGLGKLGLGRRKTSTPAVTEQESTSPVDLTPLDTDTSDTSDDEDLDDGRLSPQARRRRRRRLREQRSMSVKEEETEFVPTNTSETGPIADDDPLLADGDIQFEWQS